jgi:D-sedoheptulose 7-phosphate isomerase
MSHISDYLKDVRVILKILDRSRIEKMVQQLLKIREQHGRLFFLGNGGSASNCSHAVNDFRKIAGFEAYTPVDNISELTARTNDDGWDSSFARWLEISHLDEKDGIFILSVGGGDRIKKISVNLISAMEYALKQEAMILGIVGGNGGYTARVAQACVVIPTVNSNAVTPHTETFQSLILHLIVSDPRINRFPAKWESIN